MIFGFTHFIIYITYSSPNYHMQFRISTTTQKSIIEETSKVRYIEMRFLDKESSQQYHQVIEESGEKMKASLWKQSRDAFFRNKASPRSLCKASQEVSSIKNKQRPKSWVERNALMPASQGRDSESQTRVGLIKCVKKVPYKLSFKSLLVEILIAYSLTFAFLYFIQLGHFPYFEILLVIALTVSVLPWHPTNLIILFAVPIVVANYVMNLGCFTYPSVAICYISVGVFNERHKKKQIFIFTLIFTVVYGFTVLPAIYTSIASSHKTAYVYIFPLLVLIPRVIVSYSYWIIEHTAFVFLQLPLFLTGLEYGTILSQSIYSIQFWYLILFFTLQIISDRTQFFLRFMISATQSHFQRQEKSLKQKKQHKILPPHSNGYVCLHSFHLFLLVYIYAKLDLYAPPYSSRLSLDEYTNPWYKPIVVWLLGSLHEVFTLGLTKRAKHRILLGFTSNEWQNTVLRGLILTLGLWAFYLGLAIGARIYSTS